MRFLDRKEILSAKICNKFIIRKKDEKVIQSVKTWKKGVLVKNMIYIFVIYS